MSAAARTTCDALVRLDDAGVEHDVDEQQAERDRGLQRAPSRPRRQREHGRRMLSSEPVCDLGGEPSGRRVEDRDRRPLGGRSIVDDGTGARRSVQAGFQVGCFPGRRGLNSAVTARAGTGHHLPMPLLVVTCSRRGRGLAAAVAWRYPRAPGASSDAVAEAVGDAAAEHGGCGRSCAGAAIRSPRPGWR